MSIDSELPEAERIILGECVRTTVRGTKETSMHQAIAIGGVWLRLLELYPPKAQEEIETRARQLAALIGRE